MEEFNKHFKLPFELRPFQLEGAREAFDRKLCLLRHKVGYGKTVTSTVAALMSSIHDDVEQIVILSPPHLLDQWYDWLTVDVRGIPDVVLYQGTPAERKKMDIENKAVVLMSYNIFWGKADYLRIKKMSDARKICFIADEFSLKTLGGRLYKKTKDILYGRQRIRPEDKPKHRFLALNATPISKLEQIYNWTSIFLPQLYSSKRKFLNAHAKKIDPWGGVTEWRSEEKLQEIIDMFSISTEAHIELPGEVHINVSYSLEEKHLKVYKQLKEEGLEDLDLGGAEVSPEAIWSVLQRLVLNPRGYGIDVDPPIFKYLEALFDQMDPDDGVIIYTRHVEVSRLISEGLEIPAIFGGVSHKERERIFQGLKDGSIRKVVANIDSLGSGANLQMLNHTVFAEVPFRGDGLKQTKGRTLRQGQKKTCFFHFPMGKGTIQEDRYRKVFKSEKEISRVAKEESSREYEGKVKRGKADVVAVEKLKKIISDQLKLEKS